MSRLSGSAVASRGSRAAIAGCLNASRESQAPRQAGGYISPFANDPRAKAGSVSTWQRRQQFLSAWRVHCSLQVRRPVTARRQTLPARPLVGDRLYERRAAAAVRLHRTHTLAVKHRTNLTPRRECSAYDSVWEGMQPDHGTAAERHERQTHTDCSRLPPRLGWARRPVCPPNVVAGLVS